MSKRCYRIVGLATFLLAVSVFPCFCAPNTIVPGRSLGHLRLGEPSKQALPPLGAPHDADTAMGRTWSVWISQTPRTSQKYELDVLTIRDESGLHEFVEQVRVTSPYFITPQGLYAGSRLSQVQKAFPRGQWVHVRHGGAQPYAVALYDDAGHGIAFEFAPAKVRAGGVGSCRAILLHPRNSDALAEYYPWYFRS